FALRFAQMPLPTRKAEWDKLRQDIATFVGYGPVGVNNGTESMVILLREDNPQDFTEKEIATLQENVIQLLAPRPGPGFTGMFPGRKGHVWADGGVKIFTEWGALIGVGKQHFFIVKGETQDIFLNSLLSLLIQTPADRIRRCPAPSRRRPTD